MTIRVGTGDLGQRVASGMVLVVLALALTWAGGVWYRLLAAAIGAAILYEWTAMALDDLQKTHRAILGVLLGVFLLMLLWNAPVATLAAALAVALAAAALHALYDRAGFWGVGGLAYAGFAALSLAALRGADTAGLAATLFLFAVVWATDILAYFTGRALRGPKLAPTISPGKTWSGAIGGTAAAVAAGLGVGFALGAAPGWFALLLAVLVLSIVSQAGDLFESSIKRRFGVKDSGSLIPGHGGVMDRVDGLAAAAFAMFVIGAVAAGAGQPAHFFFTP